MVTERGAAALGAPLTPEVAAAIAAPRRRRRAQPRSTPSSSRGRRRRPRERRSRSATSRTRPASGRSATTSAGDQHYDFVSAFIKSMRGSDPDAAVYYLAAMLEAGEDPRFIARRMVILASEDVGNADPRALLVAVAAAHARRARRPARGAAQPRAGRDLPRARAEVERRRRSRSGRPARTSASTATPVRRRCCATRTTAAPRQLGHGEGYVYPHDDPAGFEVDYLPDELEGRRYYRPSGNGEESRVAIRTGDRAPEFDLEVSHGERVRLSDFAGRRNVLLVFHPFAFTPLCERGGARPPGEPRVVPERRDRRRLRLVRHRRRRARPGGSSWEPSTPSPRTSGRTATPPRPTASSTTARAPPSAARS